MNKLKFLFKELFNYKKRDKVKRLDLFLVNLIWSIMLIIFCIPIIIFANSYDLISYFFILLAFVFFVLSYIPIWKMYFGRLRDLGYEMNTDGCIATIIMLIGLNVISNLHIIIALLVFIYLIWFFYRPSKIENKENID